jgi:hypothetical protein
VQIPLIPQGSIFHHGERFKLNKIKNVPDLTGPVITEGEPHATKPIGDKKIFRKSTTSFLLGILAVALPFIMVPLGYLIYFPGANDDSLGYYIGFAVILWFIFALVGFLNGIQALKYIKHHPDEYGGKGYATTGIVLTSIILGFLAIIFLALLIAVIGAIA